MGKNDFKYGSGSGSHIRKQRVTDFSQVRKGQILIHDSNQFNSTNVAKIIAIDPHKMGQKDLAYMKYVNPKDHSKKRRDSDREFAIWDYQLKYDRFYKI